jgi:hypothetical protein
MQKTVDRRISATRAGRQDSSGQRLVTDAADETQKPLFAPWGERVPRTNANAD